VKSIRKTERSKPSKPQWIDDDDDDYEDDDDDDDDDNDDDDDDDESDSSHDAKFDEEEVDLPTKDRPYSKLISFQEHQLAAGQRADGASNYPTTNQPVHTLNTQSNESHRSSENVPEINTLTPLKFYSSASETVAPGKGSKNLSFLRQQLVDQLKKDRGGKLETWSERDNRINQCRALSTVDLEYNSQQRIESVHFRDFQHIADFIPVPQTIDDFDMSLFHDFPDQLHATEWELVQELVFRSNTQHDQPDRKCRHIHVVQIPKDLEEDVTGKQFTS
jgi:hypothetical protein